MGRFFQSLKQKTVAGNSGPSSSELQGAGQTIFIEKANQLDLEELILVQKAHYFQTQNGGMPHPGLSQVVSTTIPDSGTATTVLSPTNFQILKVVGLSIKNASGGDASIQVSLTDGTTSLILATGTVGDGGELPLITPLVVTSALGAGSSSGGVLLDSSLQIKVASNASVSAIVAYQTISVH